VASRLRLDADAEGARPGVPRLPEARGVRAHTPEQLEAFLERGYTFERMLADVEGLPAEPTIVMEKIF
jgi:hypothetical protein